MGLSCRITGNSFIRLRNIDVICDRRDGIWQAVKAFRFDVSRTPMERRGRRPCHVGCHPRFAGERWMVESRLWTGGGAGQWSQVVETDGGDRWGSQREEPDGIRWRLAANNPRSSRAFLQTTTSTTRRHDSAADRDPPRVLQKTRSLPPPRQSFGGLS